MVSVIEVFATINTSFDLSSIQSDARPIRYKLYDEYGKYD